VSEQPIGEHLQLQDLHWRHQHPIEALLAFLQHRRLEGVAHFFPLPGLLAVQEGQRADRSGGLASRFSWVSKQRIQSVTASRITPEELQQLRQLIALDEDVFREIS
jgi:hypothetical protein